MSYILRYESFVYLVHIWQMTFHILKKENADFVVGVFYPHQTIQRQ
jgi:hypothetical protein